MQTSCDCSISGYSESSVRTSPPPVYWIWSKTYRPRTLRQFRCNGFCKRKFPMSSTVANYISNIPTTDPAYAIGQQVQTAITEAGSTANVAAANRARQDLPSLMQQLLNALMERHKLPPATLL